MLFYTGHRLRQSIYILMDWPVFTRIKKVIIFIIIIIIIIIIIVIIIIIKLLLSI